MKKLLTTAITLLVISSFSAINGQNSNRYLSFYVYDDYGPVIGACVFIDDTSLAELTDFDGNANFNNVPPSASTYSVESFGYVRINGRAIGNATRICVKLELDE